MELPRRRTGSYEPRSAVGNILAPVSGPQGAAELRTTPSLRGGGSASAVAAARPPWATELDDADAPPSQPPPSQHQPQSKPAGRSPSTSRAQPRHADRDPHGFSFHTPAPAGVAAAPASAGAPQAPSDSHTGPWSSAAPNPVRPQSGGRAAAPVDQLDLWSRQQQQQQHQGQQKNVLQGRHSDGLYARIEHAESAAATAAAAAPAAAGGPAVRRASGSGDGPRLPSGNLSYGDGAVAVAAGRSGVAAGARGIGGARVGASPARVAPAAARSTSTPKPRPAVPPKRSTSITDNVRHNWVDVDATPERGRAGVGGGGAAAGRWDVDPGGDDRGSWLFAGGDPDPDPEPSRSSKPPARSRDPDPEPRPASDRRRQPERPASAGRAVDGYDSDGGGGGGGRASPDGQGRQLPQPSPPPPRRPRPHSPASGELMEATLSSPPPPPPTSFSTGGIGGGSGMSLGHGLSTGFAAAGRAGGGGGGSRQGGGSAVQAESARQVQALQEENTRLRDQVQHLERLLAVAPPAAAAAAAAAEAGRGRKAAAAAAAATAGRVWSAGGNADAAAPSVAAAAAAGVVLQQYKSQVIQLQRQVALMSQELQARARLSFEAEGALREMADKLQELAAGSSSGGGGGVEASSAGAAAAGGPGGGGEVPSRELLMRVHKWSKQMLGRLRSEKSESSKLFTQQQQHHHHPHHHRHPAAAASDSRGEAAGALLHPLPWSSSEPRGGGGDGAAGFGPTWLVPFIPAGGNRFLLAGGGDAAAAAAADDLAGAGAGGGGGSVAVAEIACGQAVLLADPLLAHRLELQLAAVTPRLAALAVLVRTQLLPAMPWLGLEAADRLQAEVGEAAESVAQCVEGLVQLCSLLPAGAAVFGEGPAAQEPKRRAAEVEAGRDSWLYGSPELLDAPEPPSPAVNDEGVISVPRLQAAISPLLRDRKAGSKALMDILEAVRSRSQSAASKRAALEAELRFAARSSALQSEHVAHLMMSVGMALEECRGAKDAAAIKSYFAAAAAVRQVLEAADALEVHPCETCLKALVDVIRVHRDTLSRLPDLLVNAPAADVEGRLLSKVEELHQGFKKALSRLEAHKRRHRDAEAGGGAAAAAAGQGEDSDYEDEEFDEEGLDEGSGGGSGEAGRVSRNGGAAAPRRPPLPSSAGTAAAQQRQQQQAAVKPGRPPKPRPEWQG
ncbi:hypothetical protein PLESTB_001129400 [Pleodorina starrii]|uniref:Uncharacterized protein n=1 Tax=Pleodorina starrii TaxID=330485 RepID=A0A9W6F4Z7_9CHLO|nr:hypothetical protein PLESTM_001366800 [Pleodorina starrii]GLC56637.1 hypothetical protein PLESTB_001129400 [Pleodorina starrii]GLC69025.1 hypothetical protein PLESTF_000771400 [Pleodorina starrii]